MTLYLGENLIAGTAIPIEPTRNVGQIIQSTLPLTDAGLHILDGTVIQGSGVYSAFVDYIASIYSASANYFCTEAEWQQSVTDYGVCEKFVYDSVNNTVRLPKCTSEHGDLIKSYKSGANWYRIYSDGWCEQGGQFTNVATNVGTDVNFIIEMVDTNYDISLVSVTNTSYDGGIISNYRNLTTTGMNITSSHNAGSSSYWDAATVRWSVSGYANLPSEVAVRVYEYIVVATSTKTDIEVDIDQVTTDLNQKVDKSSLKEVHVVIETYQSGTSWYRVYDDGWCEQGGKTADTNMGTTITCTLLKPYRDTNYGVSFEAIMVSTDDAWYKSQCSDFTTSSFVITNRRYTGSGTDTLYYKWRAYGYTSLE